MVEFIWRFIFYASLGLLIECVFTGLHSLIIEKNPRAVCTTYLPMGILWGFGGLFFEFIHSLLSGFWFVILMVPCLFLFEFSFGFVFMKIFNRKLWDYGGAKYGVMGLIRLDYLPFWLLLAISFDYTVEFIKNVIIRTVNL